MNNKTVFRVLILEDDSDWLEYLRNKLESMVLEQNEFEIVFEFLGPIDEKVVGQERTKIAEQLCNGALEAIDKRTVDLLITDFNLGSRGGDPRFNFYSKEVILKAKEVNIPFLVFSGSDLSLTEFFDDSSLSKEHNLLTKDAFARGELTTLKTIWLEALQSKSMKRESEVGEMENLSK